MFDIKQVLEWLKLSSKQAFVLWIISSVMLFASDELLTKIALLEIKEDLKIWIGLIWLISLAILAAEIISPVYQWITKKIIWQINLRTYQERLHALTTDEKALLSKYIDRQTRTTSIKYSDGVAKELEAAMVIRRASIIAHQFDEFPYNIQPWAWEYLNKHPELLK